MSKSQQDQQRPGGIHVQFPEPSLSDEFRRQCLFSGDQHVERLPGLGDIVDTERKITDALARKSRGKDHRKKRPPQPRIQFNEHIEVDSLRLLAEHQRDHRQAEHDAG